MGTFPLGTQWAGRGTSLIREVMGHLSQDEDFPTKKDKLFAKVDLSKEKREKTASCLETN